MTIIRPLSASGPLETELRPDLKQDIDSKLHCTIFSMTCPPVTVYQLVLKLERE